jgi:hypothetical protein
MGEAGPQAGGDRHCALVSRRFLTNIQKQNLCKNNSVNNCDIILIISIEIIFKFSQSFGWDLVVLHTLLSMSSKFLVHAWSWC